MIYNLPKTKITTPIVGLYTFDSSDGSQILSTKAYLDDGSILDENNNIFGSISDDDWLKNSSHFTKIKGGEYIFSFKEEDNNTLDEIIGTGIHNTEDLYQNYNGYVIGLIAYDDSYDPAVDYQIKLTSDYIFNKNTNYPYFFITKGEKQSNGKYAEFTAVTNGSSPGDENGDIDIFISGLNIRDGIYLVIICPKQ